MPIYEYECTSCNKIIESWQSVKDAPLQECPECSGHLKKLISMSSFQLKGGGWYADGYSSAGAGKSGGKDGCGASSSDSSAKGCSSETKAACGCSS